MPDLLHCTKGCDSPNKALVSRELARLINRSVPMKVVSTEFEPQVRAVPVAEILAPVRRLPTAKRRIMLTPAAVEARLFHAL
ncbi:hypothetical protein [Sandarakinorhabdus sp. AAP62]|uniref:hypothetical protein n=1 Tax=Sandarakinorhabdus sp. AAP62 TaxID=1248916 RepID=UPI001267018E|nr:hypothetical protein [Sandarakinorhabdus sp. AAP62]